MLIAHRLSREAKPKATFEQVVADFRNGKSWEDIAGTYNADLARLTAIVQRSQVIVEQRAEDRAPPATGGRPSVVPPSGGMPVAPGRRGY